MMDVPGGPEPVDSATRDQSPFGVLHMVGNVREWVGDPWVPGRPPNNGQGWLERGQRTFKGSSWMTSLHELTSLLSVRTPGFADYLAYDLGFRCAKSKKP